MKPYLQNRENELSLPWDLSEWVSKKTLFQWIVEEIETLDWANPELVAYLRAHPGYRPKMMLCLITYAYATGACEAEDVARLYYTDPAIRALADGEAPSLRALSRFRRENRGLIKWSLLQVLKRAFRAKFDLGDILFPAGLRRYLAEAAVLRIDIARHMERAAQGA